MVETQARVLPRQEALHGLGEDLLLLEHHLEEPLLEELLEAGEVDVVHGEVAAVLAEEAEGDQGVDVSVGDDEVSERLRGGDHGGDGLAAPGGVGGTIAQVVAGGGVRDSAEPAVERAVAEEALPEGDGDGDDELPVGDSRQDEVDHALGPLDGAPLSA